MKKILTHLKRDPVLAELVTRLPRPELSRPSQGVFADLLKCIIYQQLSGQVAQVIHQRFLQLFRQQRPRPQKLALMTTEQLRAVGLSNQKADYVRQVAEFFLREKIKDQDFLTLSDEEIISYLSQIKGVGRWTCQMILMFYLTRPDVFPVDDLGIQQGMVRAYSLTETGKLLKARMQEIAAPWQPYRSYGSWYMWRVVEESRLRQ